MLLMAALYVHFSGGFPAQLDTALALTAGLVSLITSAFSLAASNDRPWGN